MPHKSLFIADVAHARLSPKRNTFHYKVYYLCFALSAWKELKNSIFSLGKFNLFSIHEKDYGDGTTPPEAWIKTLLQQRNISQADGEIVLLTLPRVLGYAFNPVSFWFCLDATGNLRAVLVEVSNTFGEKHCYLCYHEDNRVITAQDWLFSNKVFHVSPFLPVRGDYHFRFAYSANKIAVWIDYYEENEKILATSLIGKRYPYTTKKLLACFFRYPLVTIKVIALIHYQALKLVRKGIHYRRKPPVPPEEFITYNDIQK